MARVTRVDLKEGEDGEMYPSEITMTVSLEEAAAIAVLFGAISPAAWTKLEPSRSWGLDDVSPYSGLTGDVFNRYWEDGVNDVLRLGKKTLNDLILGKVSEL